MPSLSAYCLTGVSLTLDVGYLLMAAAPDLGHGVSPLGHSLLQRRAATAHPVCLVKCLSPTFTSDKSADTQYFEGMSICKTHKGVLYG